MKIENNVIEYYSGGLMYEKEFRGEKNNAVEVITNTEWVQIAKSEIKKIRIIDTGSGKYFTCDITDISTVGRIADRLIVVITWKVEE